MRDPLASSDLVVQSRYAYALAAARDGDWLTAAEVLEQALERAPDWPPALFALGEAREKLGDAAGAADAFRATLAADPLDRQGAAARLALLGATPALVDLPPAYVARLFDDYAPRFDRHLAEALGYRGPTLIVEALDALAPGRRFESALDLGCGTGLAGAALRGRVDRLAGVDLSAAMIARASLLAIYDALEVGDVLACLGREERYDLLVAVDVLGYLGDLAPLLAAAARALEPSGLFAFTVESCAGVGFMLRATLRFAHAEAYVEATAARAGLRAVAVRQAPLRREAGVDVDGRIYVLARV